VREHQLQSEPGEQLSREKERRLREDTFAAFMHHWQRCDDRQRRTWLAWFTGQLPVESLKAMKIRLSKKEAK
jgi:hypothetical protein